MAVLECIQSEVVHNFFKNIKVFKGQTEREYNVFFVSKFHAIFSVFIVVSEVMHPGKMHKSRLLHHRDSLKRSEFYDKDMHV